MCEQLAQGSMARVESIHLWSSLKQSSAVMMPSCQWHCCSLFCLYGYPQISLSIDNFTFVVFVNLFFVVTSEF